MSAFLAVIEFFAFDLFGCGGESPGGALLIVQFFTGFLTELFAGDEFRHGVHILSLWRQEQKKPGKRSACQAFGGSGGIRTHEPISGLPDFEG